MIDVKYHACLRYAQRVMGLDVEELSPVQVDALRGKILSDLTPHLPAITKLEEGVFPVNGYGFVVDHLSVVTVKYTTDERPHESVREVRGGRMQSGSKTKKRRNIDKWSRQSLRT